MNFLKNLYKDNINRFSYNLITWIILSLILIFLIFIIFLQVGDFLFSLMGKLSLGYYLQPLVWIGICGTPTIFMPFLILSTIYLYFFLRHKEKQYPDFRIKNKFITQNFLYGIFSIAANCFLIYHYIRFAISTYQKHLFFNTILVALVFAFFFNHFGIRIFLNRFIDKKDNKNSVITFNDKFSFHTVVWIGCTVFAIFLLCLFCFLFFNNIDTDKLLLFLIIASSFAAFSIIYQFLYLKHKEKQHPNFRIKNEFLLKNIFYNIPAYCIFALTVFFTFAVCFCLIFCTITWSKDFVYFLQMFSIFNLIPFGVVCFINFLFSKFVLDKIIDKYVQ